MMTLKPSLQYLTSIIGINNFNLFRDVFDIINDDNESLLKNSDRDLAIILYENQIEDDFFCNQKNLIFFIKSLHIDVQNRILNDLGLDDPEDLVWTKVISEYFYNTFHFPSKFLLNERNDVIKRNGYCFIDKPDVFFKKLKEYQSKVFFDVSNYLLRTPFSRCIMQMPTGSGKTRTAMEVVSEFINNNGKDVVWLANTEELCYQAFESFIETWTFLKLREVQVINHQNSKDEIRKNIPCFHIITIQSLNNKSDDQIYDLYGFRIKDVDLLVMDEAHISIAPTYKKTISKFIQAGTKLLGLTATPGRALRKDSDKDDDNNELSDFYNGMKFEIEINDMNPIEYLRDQGILSNATFTAIEGSKIDEIISNEKDISDSKLLKEIERILTEDSHRTYVIFKQLCRFLEDGKKVLFFGTSVNHSRLICSLLAQDGYQSAHLDGNSGKYRKKIIDEFKKGDLRILCNYGVLSTGFDDPKIDVVFMARPTNSIVLYSQIIGRGLRGPLIGGTDSCEIVTVLDNISALPSNDDIYNYFDEYFLDS